MQLVRRLSAVALGLYLGWMYVHQGWIKFDPNGFWTAAFQRWGYPPALRWLVGAVEVAGGVSLIVPPVASYGAASLVIVMLGAAVTRARGNHWVDVAWIVAYTVGLLWIAATWWGLRWRFPARPDRDLG